MKNSKVCPKCNSNDVLRIEGTMQSHGNGNNIAAGVTAFSQVLVTKYLCCNCGFMEDWIDNLSDVEKIRKHHLKRQK